MMSKKVIESHFRHIVLSRETLLLLLYEHSLRESNIISSSLYLSLHRQKTEHLLTYKVFNYFSFTLNENLLDFVIIKLDYLLKDNQPITKKIKLQIKTETKYLLIEREATKTNPN